MASASSPGGEQSAQSQYFWLDLSIHSPDFTLPKALSMGKIRQNRPGYLLLCLKYKNINKKMITCTKPNSRTSGTMRNRLFHSCGVCKRRKRSTISTFS
jgi:hypothetical protein